MNGGVGRPRPVAPALPHTACSCCLCRPAGLCRHEDMREMEIAVTSGKEVESLLDVLKAHFQNTGGAKTDKQRQAQKQV